jgi:hypothetical protein
MCQVCELLVCLGNYVKLLLELGATQHVRLLDGLLVLAVIDAPGV